ncbi:MAG: S8 family peptidase [Blastocatellia bacterium]
MKYFTAKFFTLTLSLILSCPWHAFPSAQTQTLQALRAAREKAKPSKLAPDLEVLLADDDEEERQALAGKTLAQVRQNRRTHTHQRAQDEGDEAPRRTRIGRLLLPSSEVLPEEKQSFIVQVDGATANVVLREKVVRLGGTIRQVSGSAGLLTIEAPRTVIRQIAADSNVAYVSPDRPVGATGHLSSTTGADQIRNLISTTTRLNGSGIGVAVIDSAYIIDHLLTGTSEYLPELGTMGVSFVPGTIYSNDNYGHGTHVASLIRNAEGSYGGIAPAARLLSLQALDDNGAGSASSVIAALDWCVANKTTYNIRVINLSLGTMAKDSYTKDPLCLAARRAVNAGIVVVASAGNNGKDANGAKVYGAINAPGIDPSVITVGASNTFGTDARSDDQVATYSSRGPTRGYVTLSDGTRKYDNLIKPDLVAPGNKLIGAQSERKSYNGSYVTSGTYYNNLILNYPSLNVSESTGAFIEGYLGHSALDGTMYLSGTSMAAPVVSGAVALMLQANPNLTPSLVKAILMYSAQPLKGFNMFEQGAGQLNVDGAVRLARLVKATLPTTVGAALLKSSLPTPQSTIAGQSFKWGQGVITNWGFLTGSNLLTQWQGVYGSGQILGDATIVSNNFFSLIAGKTSSGITLKSGAVNITSSGQILGDGIIIGDSVALANGIAFADGQILGDGIILGDGQILGDGTTRADTTLKNSSAFLGDNTTAMLPVP